jgi:hypothetical protein
MRAFIRMLTCALGITCLAVATAMLSTGGALAQAQMNQMAPGSGAAPQIKQMALTEKQIEGVIAAQKDMDKVTEKLPQDAKPDPKVIAQLEALAKKNGFSSYDEYNDVVDNINLVQEGFDPTTKKYVGSDAVIKAEIAQVQANKNMSAKDKNAALADLNQALKAPEHPINNKGNIDLVAKYYDKLADVLGSDQK